MGKENLPDKILFFDGDCSLCNGWVRFVLRYEKSAQLYFAPLQSETAELLLKNYHPLPDSLILLDNESLSTESLAVLNICRYLKWYWQWTLVFRLFPTTFLNFAYRFVARNRIRWFGKAPYCSPLGAERQRFLR